MKIINKEARIIHLPYYNENKDLVNVRVLSGLNEIDKEVFKQIYVQNNKEFKNYFNGIIEVVNKTFETVEYNDQSYKVPVGNDDFSINDVEEEEAINIVNQVTDMDDIKKFVSETRKNKKEDRSRLLKSLEARKNDIERVSKDFDNFKKNKNID